MDFLKLIEQRYSVRSYSDRPVEQEKLDKILEAGRLVPTAVNEQPQRIFVLRSPGALSKVREICRYAFNAPVVLLVCYDKNISWKADKYGDDFDAGQMNATIVTTAMMMQAAQLGIGSLWVRGYHTQDVIDAFGLPDNIVPVCMLDLGYPAEDSKPSAKHFSRLPLTDTVKEL
ncbi:MAG: nitroreductase family protein [Oscillospiraceae bacterium]|nr:nitroreductase family protein [Oscillospiraceae bacterium]